MSMEALKTVIGRAMIDAEFRELLFKDPAQALAGYSLTEDEVRLFQGLEREKFEALAGELGERLSRAGLHIGAGAHAGGDEVGKAIHSGGVISAAEGKPST